MRETATQPLKYLCVALLLSTAIASAFPQETGVSADDIAGTKKRYGQDSGNVDKTLVDELFGTNANSVAKPSQEKQQSGEYGLPQGIVEDNKYDNCSYYHKDGYSCVPYYQCNAGYIITDAEGLFDIRGAFDVVELDPESSKCESYLEVCCRSDEYFGLPPPTRPTRRPTTTEKPTPAPYIHKCGRRNKGGIGVRIQNEEHGGTQFGEWPHMCAVLNQTKIGGDEVNLYVCGASLIAPGIAMTGAHCVHKLDAANIKVRCGEWDTQQNIEPVEHEDRYAKHVTIHPDFSPRNLQNDMALIHLESSFYISPHIDTICLPNQYDHQYSYLPENCVATGWGKDEFGAEGQYQVILKQVEMDLVPSHTENGCEERLRTTRVGTRFELDRSFLCAGGVPGKDTCKGDGGGPLVCPTKIGVPYEDQQYVQAGIVAWGIGCGTHVPGVYANVSDSLCFIDWATKCEEGQDADYYEYFGCRRWAKRQYCQATQRKADIEYQLGLPYPDEDPKLLRKELRKMYESISNYAKGVQSCRTGDKDLNCEHYDYFADSDDIPLASNARQGPGEDKKEEEIETGPKLNLDEDEDEEENHDVDEDEDDDEHNVDDPRTVDDIDSK